MKKKTSFTLSKESMELLKVVAEADKRNMSFEIEYLIQKRAKELNIKIEP